MDDRHRTGITVSGNAGLAQGKPPADSTAAMDPLARLLTRNAGSAA
ncbi:hypothetical protein AB0I81_00110 [Nonomuraea sp. NPDC050404]